MKGQHLLKRFLIISDTHDFEFENGTGAFRLPIDKGDIVLHTGNLTNVRGSPAFKNALKMLGAIDAELKFVIARNRDLDLDAEYWRTSLQNDDDPEKVKNEFLEEYATAMDIMTGPLAAEAGVTYLEDGTHTVTLKIGARFTVYASPYTPILNNWAFGYEHTYDRFNLLGQVTTGVISVAQNSVPDFLQSML